MEGATLQNDIWHERFNLGRWWIDEPPESGAQEDGRGIVLGIEE